MAYEYPDPDLPIYDPQGPPVGEPPDPGYDTNPYANQPGGGGVYSGETGVSDADIQQLQQDPSVWQYLTKALGITNKADLGRLITAAGGVYALVAGLHQGNQQIEQLVNSAAQARDYNYGAAARTQQLGNPDITAAQGTRRWTTGPDGRPMMTDTYSPGEQALYEQQLGLKGQKNVLAGQALGQLGTTLSKPFGLAGNVPTVDMSKMGAGIMSDPGEFGQIQTGLDYSGAPGMPIADEALRQKVTDDVMAQQMPAFNKLWNEQERATIAQLRAEGQEPGMPGYDAELAKIHDAKGQAFNELQRGATAQGLSAMNTRFGENMQSRQQGVGEINTQGAFANAAQGQGAEQLLARFAGHNTAQAQGTGQYLAGIGANQAARGQQFGEYTAGYTMPAYLSSFLTQGAGPTPLGFPTPTGATVAQSQYDPLGTAKAIGTQGAANVGNVATGINAVGNYLNPPQPQPTNIYLNRT